MDYNNILKNLKVQTNNKLIPEFKIENSSEHIFIHFWATWCGPCRNELPELEKIYINYKGKVDFILISCDNSKLDIDTYIFNNKFTFPVGYDLNNKISNLFSIRSIPSSFFIKSIENNNYKVENIVGSMDYDTLNKTFNSFVN